MRLILPSCSEYNVQSHGTIQKRKYKFFSFKIRGNSSRDTCTVINFIYRNKSLPTSKNQNYKLTMSTKSRDQVVSPAYSRKLDKYKSYLLTSPGFRT